jgi:hypothetical protein
MKKKNGGRVPTLFFLFFLFFDCKCFIIAWREGGAYLMEPFNFPTNFLVHTGGSVFESFFSPEILFFLFWICILVFVFCLSGLSDPFFVSGVYALLRLDTYRLQLGDCLSHFQRGFDELFKSISVFLSFSFGFCIWRGLVPPSGGLWWLRHLCLNCVCKNL